MVLGKTSIPKGQEVRLSSDETNCVHVSTHENRCLIMLLDIKSLLLRLCFMGRDYILISACTSIIRYSRQRTNKLKANVALVVMYPGISVEDKFTKST